MTRLLLIVPALAVAALTASSSLLARQEYNAPGLPTIAKMYVLNRSRAEAIPVALQNTGETVTVALVPTTAVALVPTTVVGTRAARQLWDYRELAVGVGQDATLALNTVGADGWEAVCATPSASGVVWTLKRPR